MTYHNVAGPVSSGAFGPQFATAAGKNLAITVVGSVAINGYVVYVEIPG